MKWRATVAPGLLVAVLVLSLLASVGCTNSAKNDTKSNSDNYEGTWIQKGLAAGEEDSLIIINKVGDEYSFSGRTDGEPQGYILHTDPTESGQVTLYSMILDKGAKAAKDGAALKLTTANKTITFSVSGDKMTMAVPGVERAFTFSRTTTSSP